MLYPPGNPRALAERLNEFLRSPEALVQAKLAALRAANEIFCWERQEEALIESVGRALQV
jgi:hypothetical protein